MERIHQGVYLVGHRKLSWHGRCMAVVLTVRPSVASHESAAAVLGLVRYKPGTIHVTAPTIRRPRRGFVVHTAELCGEDIARVEGIPVTSLPRTYLDLAAEFREDRLGRVLARAEELGVLDLRPVEALLDRSASHPGASRLSGALDIYRPQAVFTRSGLERRFLELIIAAGLPAPAMNFNVSGFEVDAYWEKERFGVELDVYETHGSHASFEKDRRMQDDLLLFGVETIRVTGPRLKKEPTATIKRVADHLERRRSALCNPLGDKVQRVGLD